MISSIHENICKFLRKKHYIILSGTWVFVDFHFLGIWSNQVPRDNKTWLHMCTHTYKHAPENAQVFENWLWPEVIWVLLFSFTVFKEVNKPFTVTDKV